MLSLWTDIKEFLGLAESDAVAMAGKVRAEVSTALVTARATALADVQHASPEVQAAVDRAMATAVAEVEKVLAPG
jgi:hypothetical protein